MTAIVIDASIAATWLLGDEQDELADRALSALETRLALAPLLWRYEMRNVLLTAHRRDRLTAAEMDERIAELAALPIEIDAEHDLGAALRLARTHRLSFYDGLYLELALRREAALVSLDARLASAAQAEGVPGDI